MSEPSQAAVTSVVIAGLGGQGVITASDILARAAFAAGYDLKKSEIHGMSQRGGSVASDVRFGPRVWSPMASPGEVDYLLVLEESEVGVNRARLRKSGVLITPAWIDAAALAQRRGINVALLGALSRYLAIPEAHWTAAIRATLAPKLHEANLRAFQIGRDAAALRLAQAGA